MKKIVLLFALMAVQGLTAATDAAEYADAKNRFGDIIVSYQGGAIEASSALLPTF